VTEPDLDALTAAATAVAEAKGDYEAAHARWVAARAGWIDAHNTYLAARAVQEAGLDDDHDDDGLVDE
jgi:hypothetical protein